MSVIGPRLVAEIVWLSLIVIVAFVKKTIVFCQSCGHEPHDPLSVHPDGPHVRLLLFLMARLDRRIANNVVAML